MFKFLSSLFQSPKPVAVSVPLSPNVIPSTTPNTIPSPQDGRHKPFTPNDYELKLRFWDGANNGILEKSVYTLLSSHLDKRYILLPHVSLREIFRTKATNDYKATAFLASHHVDFLILYKTTWQPVVAIELDGLNHVTDPQQQKSDLFKDILFREHNINRIKIFNEEAQAHINDITFFQKKIYRIPTDPVYCIFDGTRMKGRTQKNSDTLFFYCNCDDCNYTIAYDKLPDYFTK